MTEKLSHTHCTPYIYWNVQNAANYKSLFGQITITSNWMGLDFIVCLHLHILNNSVTENTYICMMFYISKIPITYATSFDRLDMSLYYKQFRLTLLPVKITSFQMQDTCVEQHTASRQLGTLKNQTFAVEFKFRCFFWGVF